MLRDLPSEITIDILSRLPPLTTLFCKLKCVSKSWCEWIETPEFSKSAPPCLAVFEGGNKSSKLPYKICELDDKNSCINEAFSFSFPHLAPLHSSLDGFDGLLLLIDRSNFVTRHNLIICNPITRDYIKIPSPRLDNMPELVPWFSTTGFGVSKTTSQYKLVRIFRRYDFHHLQNDTIPYYCRVYTLGSKGGLWRSTALTSSSTVHESNMVGVFSNGNIHWLGRDSNGFPRISCFDLETELFTTPLSPPPPHLKDKMFSTLTGALSDCLGLCDNSSQTEIVMWLMKDYGDDKSWTKQYVIPKFKPFSCWDEPIYVIKLLKDGDVLIRRGDSSILCYSNKTRSIRETAVIESRSHSWTRAVWFTPSFLPLKTLFPMENVSSF